MTCTDLRELLSAYADGETSLAQREMLELHLERCRTCQTRLGDYRRVHALLASLPADSWIPPVPPRLPVGRRAAIAPLLARYAWPVVPLLLVGLTINSVHSLGHRSETLPRSTSGRVHHIARSGLPVDTALAGVAQARGNIPAAVALPEEDRGAIVVLVYRGSGNHPVLHRQVAVGQVENLAETWSHLVQVLQRESTGPGAPPMESRPAPRSRNPGGGASRWSALRPV